MRAVTAEVSASSSRIGIEMSNRVIINSQRAEEDGWEFTRAWKEAEQDRRPQCVDIYMYDRLQHVPQSSGQCVSLQLFLTSLCDPTSMRLVIALSMSKRPETLHLRSHLSTLCRNVMLDESQLIPSLILLVREHVISR